MNEFVFEGYDFDNGVASFRYRYQDLSYVEKVTFKMSETFNRAVLERALFLAFLTVGTSYYKAFPAVNIKFESGSIDSWQAEFCNMIYQEGLSQYAFENMLTRKDLAQFVPTSTAALEALPYAGSGIISLQSGGKDSLLVAKLLEKTNAEFIPWYVTNGTSHPHVLDELSMPLQVSRRSVDMATLQLAKDRGGKNGHVPVTYIVQSFAVIQAVLLGQNTVLAAVAHEGEEPHEWIGDLPVNHQWSKTWQAEKLLAEYVERYISPDIHIGSPLRSMSELKVAELFAMHAWEKFGSKFSSCNEANYRQGEDNTELSWCGHCPKCANSYLLFSPFVSPKSLQARLGGALYQKPELTEIFKGLLGIDGAMKPFECVGEVDELRRAYHMSQMNGYDSLPFSVPVSNFDKDARYESQKWANDTIDL